MFYLALTITQSHAPSIASRQKSDSDFRCGTKTENFRCPLVFRNRVALLVRAHDLRTSTDPGLASVHAALISRSVHWPARVNDDVPGASRRALKNPAHRNERTQQNGERDAPRGGCRQRVRLVPDNLRPGGAGAKRAHVFLRRVPRDVHVLSPDMPGEVPQEHQAGQVSSCPAIFRPLRSLP